MHLPLTRRGDGASGFKLNVPLHRYFLGMTIPLQQRTVGRHCSDTTVFLPPYQRRRRPNPKATVKGEAWPYGPARLYCIYRSYMLPPDSFATKLTIRVLGVRNSYWLVRRLRTPNPLFSFKFKQSWERRLRFLFAFCAVAQFSLGLEFFFSWVLLYLVGHNTCDI